MIELLVPLTLCPFMSSDCDFLFREPCLMCGSSPVTGLHSVLCFSDANFKLTVLLTCMWPPASIRLLTLVLFPPLFYSFLHSPLITLARFLSSFSNRQKRVVSYVMIINVLPERFTGNARSMEPRRNGVKGPPDRRMENGVRRWLKRLFTSCKIMRELI